MVAWRFRGNWGTSFRVEAPNYAAVAEELGNKDKALRNQMTRSITKVAREAIVPDLKLAVMGGFGPQRRARGSRARTARALDALRKDSTFKKAAAGQRDAIAALTSGTANSAIAANVAYKERTRRNRQIDTAFARAGLRETIARSINVDNRTRGRSAGVRVQTRNSNLPPDQRALPRLMNRGRWRHPVFGNRDNWVQQESGNRGWWKDTMFQHRPRVKAAVQKEFAKWVDEAAKVRKEPK